MVERWFSSFQGWELPHDTEILCVVDSDDPAFARDVISRVDGKVRVTGNAKLGERAPAALRRARVKDNIRWFQEKAQGAVILGAEDDTIPDTPDAYMRLLDSLTPDVGFVQGTEIGRWDSPIIPHWKITKEEGKVVRTETGDRESGIVEIDGGGFYLFVCPTDIFKSIDPVWTEDPPIPLDVDFVMKIQAKGYRCLGDWNITATHVTETGDLTIGKTGLVKQMREKESWYWPTYEKLI